MAAFGLARQVLDLNDIVQRVVAWGHALPAGPEAISSCSMFWARVASARMSVSPDMQPYHQERAGGSTHGGLGREQWLAEGIAHMLTSFTGMSTT